MLLIDCPFCGPRAEIEFRNAGEAHIDRPLDPSAHSDENWGAHLYARTNPLGEHAERWRHVHGCGRFFNSLRDTLTDQIVATYPVGTPRCALTDPVDAGAGFKDGPVSEGAA